MNGQTNSKDVAIKVSWKRSRDSVENECSILKEMEKYKVPHVEKCLSRSNNPYPFAEGRVMIALMPVISSSDGITSSINNVKPGQPQRNAIKSTVETMIGMLKAGIYTLDIQPLINIETGETTFIDFTEAKQLSSLSDDESALVGFCSEMFVLIPDSLKEVAEDYLRTELNLLKNRERGTLLPENILDIVESIWLD